MRRITRALAALALLPSLVSGGAVPPDPAPRVQACHYEEEIHGVQRRRDGSTFEGPLGSIVVAACSSPADLARRVEELTNNVRTQATATAQAVQAGRAP